MPLRCNKSYYYCHRQEILRSVVFVGWLVHSFRAGFKGGPGGPGPRPPTNKGPPTKPFIFRPPVYGSNGRTYKMLVIFFLFFQRQISELPRPIAVKLYHTIGIWFYFIMQVQKFRGHSPKKIWGPKTCKILVNFGPLQTLIANISGTAQDIQNRKANDSRWIPPAFNEKDPVNFGPLITEIWMWVWTHKNAHFWHTISRPLGGAAPWNFYTR